MRRTLEGPKVQSKYNTLMLQGQSVKTVMQNVMFRFETTSIEMIKKGTLYTICVWCFALKAYANNMKA